MKVLAFRHVPFEGIGRLAPLLAERGIACDYADLYREGEPDPDIAAYAGLIFLGGPMSANDPLPCLDRPQYLRPAVSSGSNSRHDRGLASTGPELRRCSGVIGAFRPTH